MASQAVGRAGVIAPPSLPTIRETTLSWLGSELESSLFSTNGRIADNDPAAQKLANANVQRCIDFDEQCLSLKSGDGSDFSGIQPLPVGSDDTPPTAANDFNRVVRVDFQSLLSDSQNIPKPVIQSDNDEEVEACQTTNANVEKNVSSGMKPITPSDFQTLIGMLDEKVMEGDIGNLVGFGDNPAIEKLQLIRLWQLMQQEELRRRQEAEIAMLNAQRARMKLDRGTSHNAGLEKVEIDAGDDSQGLDDLENGDLESNLQEGQDEDGYLEDDAFGELADDKKVNESQEAFDEIPVERKKKSFEQLLEEELRKEQENKKRSLEAEKLKGPVKRPFLKKGQGLARFAGPPVRRPPKTRQENNAKLQNNLRATSHTLNNKKGPAQTQNLVSKKSSMNSVRSKVQKPLAAFAQSTSQRSQVPMNKLQLKPEIPFKGAVQEEDSRLFRPAGDADLEEFEMLERYAEDDASFFSEPSLVVSVLQQDLGINGAERDEKMMSLRERVRERRRLREEARAKIQHAPGMSELRVENTKNPRITAFDSVSDNFQKAMQSNDADDLEEDEILSPLPPKPYFKPQEVQKARVMQRKTVSLVKKEKLIRPIAQSAAISPVLSQTHNFMSNAAFSELQSSPNSAFSPHQHPVVVQGRGDPCDEDQDVGNNDFQDDQTWGDIDMSVVNTSLHPDVTDSVADLEDENCGREYKCSDYMELENEDVENPVRDTDAPKVTLVPGLSLSPPPPPTTLMQKLFPGLKMPKSSRGKKDNLSEDKKEDSQEPTVADLDPDHAPESQTSLLKQKLQELESEIARFKKENLTLENLRRKQEEDARNLAREVEEFRKQKDEELARLEEYKKTETKKLKKERKLFEEHVLATRMMPRKEEREEIQKLQEELEGQRADNKAKEQRWISANNRMRNQVERFSIENQELQERINEMEAQRVKDLNAQRSGKPKQPSVWKSVNKMVESEFSDLQNENIEVMPKQTAVKTPLSTNSNITNGAKSLKNPEKTANAKRSTNAVKSAPASLSPDVAFSNLRDTMEKTKLVPQNQPETVHKDGKVERTLRDGSRVVVFPNGTQKEISADGKMVKVRFANGDIKQIYGDGSIVYYYEENGTTHTTHSDGLQVFEFPNKQVEHHFPDGTKQITFPDQTVKYLHTDGTEQTVFPDGTEMHISTNKDKTIVFANGQREIHTGNFKRREYPDGTSKTVFEDGRQETRYASGRLRVKDAHGNVIVDRMTT